MRSVVCPQCQQTLQVPEDLAKAHCVRCGRAIDMDTNITAQAPTTIQAPEPEVGFERQSQAAAAAPVCYADWEDFRSASPALQRVWLDLATRPLPDLRGSVPLPLPPGLPSEADAFGIPLATVTAPGENRVLIHFLTAILSASGFIALPIVFIENDPMPFSIRLAFAALCILGGLASGYYIAFVRNPEWPVTLWVFEHGLVWERGGKLGASRWADVPGFDMSNETGVTRLRLKMPGFYAATYGRDKSESLALLEYIATKMTADQFMPFLRRVFDGERVRFGIVELDRGGFNGQGFYFFWSDIKSVGASVSQVQVEARHQTTWRAVRLRNVSNPYVMLMICAIMIEDAQRLPPIEGPIAESKPDPRHGDDAS